MTGLSSTFRRSASPLAVTVLLAACQVADGQQPVESAETGVIYEPVSLDDYRAGFDAFQECAATSGITVFVDSVDPQTGLISYGVRDGDLESSPALEACYVENFKELELGYTFGNPEVVEAAEREQIDELFPQVIAPCLDKNGIEYAVPERTDSEEWLYATQHWMQLVNSGKC